MKSAPKVMLMVLSALVLLGLGGFVGYSIGRTQLSAWDHIYGIAKGWCAAQRGWPAEDARFIYLEDQGASGECVRASVRSLRDKILDDPAKPQKKPKT